MSRLPIFLSSLFAITIAAPVMGQQGLVAPPVSIAMLDMPALPQNDASPVAAVPEKLTLVPEKLPLPADMIIGTGPAQPDAKAFPKLIAPTASLDIPLLDKIENYIDFQDVQWPLGEALEGHFMLPMDHPVGNWVPFLSVLQDNDELDAHIRNGIGVGATYRFNKNARVDVQVQYLESSGDVNPAIGEETRASVIFTFDF